MLTGSQIRAARGLLNMSVAELCERTGLAINTIRRAEATNGVAPITIANMMLIRSTLEADGVVFIKAGRLGAGVRMASPEPMPVKLRRRG